jgi:hypothetical protein
MKPGQHVYTPDGRGATIVSTAHVPSAMVEYSTGARTLFAQSSLTPATRKTWIWVAEWPYGNPTMARHQTNPWPPEGPIQPINVYKIEESEREDPVT